MDQLRAAGAGIPASDPRQRSDDQLLQNLHAVLTVTEAAARLDIAPRTLQLWCRQGRVPGALLVGQGKLWLLPDPLPEIARPAMGRPRKS